MSPPAPNVSALELSVADLFHCRFAISSVSEVIEVARAIANPAARAAHSDWMGKHRRALQRLADAHNLRPLLALTFADGSTPHFLRPTPSGPRADIDAELQRIRATPTEVVRDELDDCLRARGPVGSDVQRALNSDGAAEQLAELLAAIWTELVQPSWSQIRDCLQRDILHQSLSLARRGLAAVLEQVAPALCLDDGQPVVRQNGGDARGLDETGILFLPSTFIWPPSATVHSSPARPVTIRYPARGTEVLWSAPAPERGAG